MGSYYAGMVNSGYYDDYLAHHGIKGQKWGIRRFRNADGSLTPAGRERYYGNAGEQKKLLDMVSSKNRNSEAIRKLPQIQDAGRQLKDIAKDINRLSDDYDKKEETVFNYWNNNDEVYEKYLNKAVDIEWERLKNEPPVQLHIGTNPKYQEFKWTREKLYDWYKYDDGDQGNDSSFEIFKRESKEPIVEDFRKIEKEYADKNVEFRKQAGELAEQMLPKNASDMDKSRVTAYICGVARDHANNSGISYDSKKMEKEYKKYQNVQGTKSLLGGDHRNDESVKVLTDYHNDIYKNRNRLKNLSKDSYKNKVGDIQNKYIDKYAKAVLKDMGYDTNDEAIAWLKKQPWFYMQGASAIVF